MTAFDISAAIDLCRQCYRESRVDYLVADLFLPQRGAKPHDLVYGCNTIQVLPGAYRTRARDAMISLMAPGGKYPGLLPQPQPG